MTVREGLRGLTGPLTDPALRRHFVRHETCPDCFGVLEIDLYCTECGRDLYPDSLTPLPELVPA